MTKPKLLLLSALLCTAMLQAQEISTKKYSESSSEKIKDKEDDEKEMEDMAYELKHKSQPWFQNMKKPNANYFEIKKEYDKYFGTHRWEKSKPRAFGESWIKSMIFYLDKNGNVQDPPPFDDNHYSSNKVLSPESVTATSRTIGSWTMIGPVNSATTGYSGSGNHGGYVYLNRIDPTNSNKMFVAFLTGGLWVTTDNGTNWTLTDANMPDEVYNDIDVCIGTPTVVYAMTASRVIKSTDGGMSWSNTALISTSFTGKAYDIAVSPTNSNIVVARWSDKIYRTTDGGSTWSTIVTGLPNYSLWDCSIHSEMLDWSTTDNNVVYCLSFSNSSNTNQVVVYRSADAGATFSAITTITLDPAANGQVVGWAKLLLPSNNASQIYIAIGTGANAYAHQAVQLYKLNNTTGAEVLKRVNMRPGGSTTTELHHGDIAMDRTNESKIVYGTYLPNTIFYSSDNGVSFTQSTGTTHSDLRSIDMVNGKIIIGSDGEAAVTTNNGTTITTVTNTISNHELWGFGSAFKSDLVASGNNHGPVMIKENGSGFEWYNGTGADQGNTDVNPLDDRYIYSQGYSNYRYFRTGVHTLINESNTLDAGGIYSYFNSMEFHPNYYYTLVTHHAGQYPTGNPNLATWKNSLIKSEDNGNSLTIVKTFAAQVFREKICMTNPNVMYVVVGLTNNKLWKTTDGGTNWIDVTPTSVESSGETNISDVAVSDVDPNQVWITYSGVQTACKILKSATGGTSWTNLTTAILTSNPNTKIIFQRGSDGGVYIGNKSGIYYRNNLMADWVLLGTGLPSLEVRFMFINYNLGKIKIGTSRGAWEHDLYETSPPKAQISANAKKVLCPEVETVQFKDYSTVRNASATWAWSFPGGTPSTSALENPIVSYSGAANGFYNVSLTVTDAYGTSSQTINNMIQIDNKCGSTTVDTIPGNTASLGGNSSQDYVNVTGLNLNTSGFTFSCWIKPNGIQPDYSGIFMTQTGSTFGLNFLPGTNQLGFHPNWSWSSGLTAPSGQWTHVALVSDATGVTIYANGVGVKNTSTFSNINFIDMFLGSYGRGYNDRLVNCEMDEVCLWNRALTTDEIRQWRHLTKSKAGDPILTGLIAYYQFNELEGTLTLNKKGSNHATYNGSGFSHSASTTPVGGGVSQKISVTTSGVKNFNTTGLSMTFPGTGLKPGGDVWVTRLYQNPNPTPDARIPANSYWIINNHGTNATFNSVTNMTFTGIPTFQAGGIASDFRLFKRTSNDFGNTWGSYIDAGDSKTGSGSTGTISFTTGLSVTSFSQFSLSGTSSVLPIQITDFSAHYVPNNINNVLIDLSVSSNGIDEIATLELERSTDGINFIKIYSFNLADGINTGTKTTFKFVTNTLEKNTYYRVIQKSHSGSIYYSNIETIKINTLQMPKIFPSIVEKGGSITCTIPAAWDKCMLTGYSIEGKNVINATMKAGKNQLFLNLPSGTYLINVYSKDGTYNTKITIQ